MTTERITNGSFCDGSTGWSHLTTDWDIPQWWYAGPGEWPDWESCGCNVGFGGDGYYVGFSQTVDLTNVANLSFRLYVDLYDFEGGHPHVCIFIDGVEKYRVSTGFDLDFTDSIDVSSYSGNHVIMFGIDADGWGSLFYAREISALASDVPPKPVAAFEGFPTSGDRPLTVLFTDESTNTPTSWLWDFGDGHLSAEQHPTHIYTVAGVYTVDLTATNAGGSDMETKTNYITVTEPPPPPPYVEPIWSLKIGPT
jgi:hypothetical protein